MKKQINYNVTGSDRQQLVGIIAKELGTKATYTRMPECAYLIGDLKVTKDGALEWDERTDNDMILPLLDTIAAAGFKTDDELSQDEEPETEPYTGEDLTAAETDGLMISLPMDGFNQDSLDRLQKLVDSKASLTRKALNADSLTIRVSGDRVEFPWWNSMPEPEEISAYTAFIANLCAMAKNAKRVNASEKPVESEKFAFRVWLLRMGFNGSESKDHRKVLLKRLSGPAAFPTQAAADAHIAKQKAKAEEAEAC